MIRIAIVDDADIICESIESFLIAFSKDHGIRNIMQYQSGDFVYSCGIVEKFYKEFQKPILMIELHKHPENETYDFTVSLIETLERLSYITVSKKGLTAQSFQEYADIIFMWENQFCGKDETHGQL